VISAQAFDAIQYFVYKIVVSNGARRYTRSTVCLTGSLTVVLSGPILAEHGERNTSDRLIFVFRFSSRPALTAMSLGDKELYEFGNFRLDIRERRLSCVDGAVPPEPIAEKAFQTLAVLVRNAGKLVTKPELLETVWPNTIVEENNLDKAIYAIRQALGEKPGEQKYIETVRKHGYRFVAEVRRPGAEATDPSPVRPHDGRPDADPISSGERFTPLGAEAIVSVRDFEMPQVALKAGNLAEGSVRRGAGDADRASGLYLSLIGIAIAIFAYGGWYFASRVTFDGGTNGDPPKGAAEAQARAYDQYVRGKVKVASENRDDTLAAIAMLEEAVAAEPNFAKAYAALARGYNTMAFKYSSGSESKRYHENAEVAIDKALALDPNLPEAHFARGLILWSNTEGFPHEQAIQSYKRSLALDPANDETHHQLSFVYSHIGLLDEARREIGRALDINPNNTLARYRVGVYAQYQGRFDESLAVHKTIPRDFTPLLVDRTLAEVLVQSGRANEAELIVDDYLRRFPQDEGGSFTSVKALLHAKAGRQAEAEETIRRADEIGRDYGHFHHTAYNIASAYAAMNEPEAAVQWLERAADTGFPNYLYFQTDPNLEPMRTHPKFIEFMEKLRSRWERFKAMR
jgi:DNA-binding winged helix-turn-helix (wHTH) protein/Tfp pilus assembly protein PilF